MPHLLLLEDDADIRFGLEQHLKREGFTLDAFDNGRDALRCIANSALGQSPRLEVALLDLTLPDIDGLDVLRAIRASRHYRALPVVLVTARNEEIDRVLGLELGADDYITKPFSTRELVARIRAILRRAAFMDQTDQQQKLQFGPITLDLEMHHARKPRRVLTRERILQQVWGLEYLGESRTIDAHVRRVRAKLGPAGGLIETVVGVGYRLGSVDG